MELEIRRHDWAALSSAYGNSPLLPEVVRDLRSAASRADAEFALRRLEQVLPELDEVSIAAASVLVHALWGCGPFSLDLVLGALAELAAGCLRGEAPAAIGQAVLQEVCHGFAAYVEIAESTGVDDCRTACIDLIAACGGAEPVLRARAAHFLGALLELDGFVRYQELIEASIAELRAASGE
ncbi:hypothetical protein [Amycolatopsis sp. cg9]|uniref:hypothetical protein n=1 Tax=Amycolatopsis sp. cg9 TaxID=3238801 RepID=UPI0035269D7E